MATNIIKINRGDSFEFKLKVTEAYNNKVYMLTDNDVVYFALMYPQQRFEDAIFIKGYIAEDQNNSGEIFIKITPNDTRTLAAGVYYYVVKLQRGGTLDTINDLDEPEEVRTLIERTKFIINE